MTNNERRAALAMARAKAVEYATKTETYGGDISSFIEKAKMWAHVANALKDGSPDHDAVNDDVHLEIR